MTGDPVLFGIGGGGEEVDEEAEGFAGGFQVVGALGTMFGGELLHAF